MTDDEKRDEVLRDALLQAGMVSTPEVLGWLRNPKLVTHLSRLLARDIETAWMAANREDNARQRGGVLGVEPTPYGRMVAVQGLLADALLTPAQSLALLATPAPDDE